MRGFAILSALFFISACASDIGANSYETTTANQINSAVKGIVINVRAVKVADAGNGGGLVGGVAGAAAGSLVGSNDATQIIGGALGAAAGAWAGSEAQQMATTQQGYEYVIETDSGKIITVTQGGDVMLGVGQRCIVLSGKKARVIPYGSNPKPYGNQNYNQQQNQNSYGSDRPSAYRGYN